MGWLRHIPARNQSAINQQSIPARARRARAALAASAALAAALALALGLYRRRARVEDEADEADEGRVLREIARVNAIATAVTVPAVVRRATRATRGCAYEGGDSSDGAGDVLKRRLTHTCAGLMSAAATDALARATLHLIARRMFIDAERGGTTLSDDDKARALSLASERFTRGDGARELVIITRAIVDKILKGDAFAKLETWSSADAERFMREAREATRTAMSMPSDVFVDPKALPFEREGRRELNGRAFPSWETLLLPERADGVKNAATKELINEIRLVVRSPHFTIAVDAAMCAAWHAHADVLLQTFFAAAPNSTLSSEQAARVLEVAMHKIARDDDVDHTNALVSAIGASEGVKFFTSAIW